MRKRGTNNNEKTRKLTKKLTSSRTCIDCSFTPRIKKLQDLCWSSWEFTP
jgi:hypothetical protein